MSNEQVHSIGDHIEFTGQKRLLISTGDYPQQNLVERARIDPVAKEFYKKLLAEDYILYFHQAGVSKLYLRKHVSELFQRKDLIQDQGIFYTLEPPVGRKVNPRAPKRLLVLFTCMPPGETHNSALMPDRMFPKFFDGIERNLVKNVSTMRIMDLNVSHGSHYINTVNYPNYEAELQDAIYAVIEDLNISPENVVLYGASKGGTGALYHAAAMDLKCLAVDPILDIGGDNLQNDRRFLKELRVDNVIPEINKNLARQSRSEKQLIVSEYSKTYYSQALQLRGSNLNLLNMIDESITAHHEVSKNSVPEQIYYLNRLLGASTDSRPLSSKNPLSALVSSRFRTLFALRSKRR